MKTLVVLKIMRDGRPSDLKVQLLGPTVENRDDSGNLYYRFLPELIEIISLVVGPKVLKGEFTDMPDWALGDSVALDIRVGLDELAQFLLQLRRRQRRPTGSLPIPQAHDTLGIVAHHPIT
jgi:hypothetical protein